MIYLRILIVAFNILLFVYYAMLIGQAMGMLKFTKREITFRRGIVPFYYWIAPNDEKTKKKYKRKVKPIKTK